MIFLVADPAGPNIPAPPLHPNALAYNVAIIRGGRCIGVMGMAMPTLIAIAGGRIIIPFTIAIVV
jgi:hypothetical protein